MTTRSKQSRSRQRSPTDAQSRSNEDRSRTHSREDIQQSRDEPISDGELSDMSDDVIAPVECNMNDPSSLASFLSLTLAAQGQKSSRKQTKTMQKIFCQPVEDL